MTPADIRAHILKRLKDGPLTTASLGYSLPLANGYDRAYRQVLRLKADGLIEAAGKDLGGTLWRLAQP